MKSAYPTILSAVNTEWSDYPTLKLLIEPVDRLYWTASCGKRLGAMAGDNVRRVLHFEFPAAARQDRLTPATGLLVAKIVDRLGSSERKD